MIANPKNEDSELKWNVASLCFCSGGGQDDGFLPELPTKEASFVQNRRGGVVHRFWHGRGCPGAWHGHGGWFQCVATASPLRKASSVQNR
jgi:hypothetical protein